MRQSCLHGHTGGTIRANWHSDVAKLTERPQEVQNVTSQQPAGIGGAMKKNTPEYPLGVKLFPFFFCGACAVFLALLMMNGVLQEAQMLFVAPCAMAVAIYFIGKASLRQPDAIAGPIKKISTPYTFVIKLFPFLFLGFCTFFLILLLMNGVLRKAPLFLVVPCAIAVAGYYSWKANFRDLMDEVYDCGDYLLIKKRGEEDTVPLSNIINVNFSTFRRGERPRITLTLASPGKFGTEISFAPPPNISFPRRNQTAEDLLARAEKARSAHAG